MRGLPIRHTAGTESKASVRAIVPVRPRIFSAPWFHVTGGGKLIGRGTNKQN